MLLVGSIVLAAGSLVGVALTSHGVRAGWAWLAALQVPYGVFDALTDQWGFLVMGAVFTALYWRGWRRRA